MIDIKFLRENPEAVEENIRKKLQHFIVLNCRPLFLGSFRGEYSEQ